MVKRTVAYEEVQNVEDLEQVDDEDAAPIIDEVEDDEKIETPLEKVEHASDSGEKEVLEEKEGISVTDGEAGEFGEEEGELWDEMEEGYGMTAKRDSREEEEFGFLKKKKPQPKVRRVDMDIYYPDESKTSIDERKVEKKPVEGAVEAEGVVQEIEDSEEWIDPNKDYSVVDPSFLDEFYSSEEERLSESKRIEMERKAEALEEVEEEEEEFQQEIYVQPPEREPSEQVYEKICDLETPVSSDESFKVPRFRYIPRRKSYPTQGFREEENKWLLRTQSVQSMDVPSTALLNLMENIAPALKKTLIEIATYQPSDAVYYMTHSLLHKAKTPEEIGLEPDPHLIQLIVDGQKKKKKQQQIPIIKKTDDIFMAPYAESHVSTTTPPKEVKADIPVSDDDDEDQSQLHKFQRQYRKAKKKIMTEEKAKMSNLDPRTFLPGRCLGPTTLPSSSKVKFRTSQAI